MNPVEYRNNLFKKISLLDKTSAITTKGDSLRFIYVLYMPSSLVFQSKELQTELLSVFIRQYKLLKQIKK
jgi:hypothetical protein